MGSRLPRLIIDTPAGARIVDSYGQWYWLPGPQIWGGLATIIVISHGGIMETHQDNQDIPMTSLIVLLPGMPFMLRFL